jgi:UDP-N-acetylmuramyl-tripeptide synthetase
LKAMATALASPDAAVAWLRAHVGAAGRLVADSRRLQRGDAFIAWPGHAQDARRYVPAALAAGAAACLVEAEGAEAFGLAGTSPVATLPGLKAASGPIASAWWGEPSKRLTMVATTGTNGKTSTAWWTAQALAAAGRPCGVVGTLGVGVPPAVQSTGLTTPDPFTLHETLAGFVAQGLQGCAIEASSIGIEEQRLAGLAVDVALFTNLTQDHLDYHGSMQAYGAAKRKLFAWPGLQAAVVNIDDAFGAQLARELAAEWSGRPSGSARRLITVSLQREATLQAGPRRYENGGLVFDVSEAAQTEPLCSGLVGEFNASNLLVVLGALRACGLGLAEAVAALAAATPVPGRLQPVRVDGSVADIDVIVDYAHTPDALDQVLQALRPLATARQGRLVCVFGCGGDRDPAKRAPMAAMATRLADQVIVTSDNPRSEDPAAIVAQVLAGAAGSHKARAVIDRHEAIAQAVASARAGDVLLIAGKGHETEQIVGAVRHPFSDAAEARAALERRAGVAA